MQGDKKEFEHEDLLQFNEQGVEVVDSDRRKESADFFKPQQEKDQSTTTRLGQLVQLFIEFFKLGIFTIGGGLAMISLMDGIVVEKKKWLTHEELMECLTLSQTLPGVIAIHLATYVGRKKEGFLGALVAVFAVSLPSYIVIVVLMGGLKAIGQNVYVEGALWGIKLCVCALVATVVYSMGKEFLKNWLDWILGIGVLAAVVFTKIPVPYLIVACAAIGILKMQVIAKRGGRDG